MNLFNRCWIEKINVNSSSPKNNSYTNVIAGIFPIPVRSVAGSTSYRSVGISASILLTFVNPDFREKNNEKTFDLVKTVKIVRILGLMSLISYMIVILFTWIYANMHGYVYFSAGEPVLCIKYPEWVLGFLGIFVAADYLLKELKYNMAY